MIFMNLNCTGHPVKQALSVTSRNFVSVYHIKHTANTLCVSNDIVVWESIWGGRDRIYCATSKRTKFHASPDKEDDR